MDKDSKKNSNSPATGRDEASNSSTNQQSAANSTEGKARKAKRKASPDKTPAKRARVVESEPLNTSEEDLRKTVLKRKVRDHGEGPPKKRTRKVRGSLDTESASSSVDTEKEGSSNLLDSCNTSVKDVGKRGRKRKAPTDEEGPSEKKKKSELKEDSSAETQRAAFEAKYEEQDHLGKGGCGSVFAGVRKADNFPVAIKHVPKDNIFLKQVDKDGKHLALEVAIMLKLRSGTTETVGTSAHVSLLDWYDLDQELILVLERPVPSVDLFEYIEDKGGSLQEDEAKIILKQLLEAVIELQDNCIFHRDIKTENILIQTSSDEPRVRVIDFGLSCFVKKGSYHRAFYGTSAHIPPEWYYRSTYRAGPTTVWQLGVVLFDSLHRGRSFETKSYLGGRLKISTKLSEDCRNFLRLCLSTIPERRPTLQEIQLHPWLR